MQLGKEVEKYINDYRESDTITRDARRRVASLKFFKWELIRDEIKKIDKEEVV
jgi:hypothetical protein